MAEWAEGLHTLTSPQIQPSSIAGFQTHALLKKKKLFCLKDSASKKKNFESLLLFFPVLFYFWLHWGFTASCGACLVAASRAYSAEVHGLLTRQLVLLQGAGPACTAAVVAAAGAQ